VIEFEPLEDTFQRPTGRRVATAKVHLKDEMEGWCLVVGIWEYPSGALDVTLPRDGVRKKFTVLQPLELPPEWPSKGLPEQKLYTEVTRLAEAPLKARIIEAYRGWLARTGRPDPKMGAMPEGVRQMLGGDNDPQPEV
jgi:hypothetical protein